jgi:hypothetical protein
MHPASGRHEARAGQERLLGFYGPVHVGFVREALLLVVLGSNQRLGNVGCALRLLTVSINVLAQLLTLWA